MSFFKMFFNPLVSALHALFFIYLYNVKSQSSHEYNLMFQRESTPNP